MKEKVPVQLKLYDVMDKHINALLTELTNNQTRTITAYLTLQAGHDYWFFQEYGTGTRRTTPEDQKSGALMHGNIPKQGHFAGRKSANVDRKKGFFTTREQVDNFNDVMKERRRELREYGDSKSKSAKRVRLNMQRGIDMALQRWKQKYKGKARLPSKPDNPEHKGWYLIAARGKRLRYFKGGVGHVRPFTYHPGIRPWVVNSSNKDERGINIDSGAVLKQDLGTKTGGGYLYEKKTKSGALIAGKGRGLLRVLMFRTQRKIVAEILDQINRSKKFQARGFPKDPNYALRATIAEVVNEQMTKLVAQLRRKVSRSSDNPDTSPTRDKRKVGSALADAFSFRMPEPKSFKD